MRNYQKVGDQEIGDARNATNTATLHARLVVDVTTPEMHPQTIDQVIGNADHVKTTILPAVLPVVGAMHPKKQPEGVGTVVVEMVGTVATTVTVVMAVMIVVGMGVMGMVVATMVVMAVVMAVAMAVAMVDMEVTVVEGT